jgi:hypothetical protein
MYSLVDFILDLFASLLGMTSKKCPIVGESLKARREKRQQNSLSDIMRLILIGVLVVVLVAYYFMGR